MQGIKIDTAIKITLNQMNGDCSMVKIEKNQAVCIMADGKTNQGILSDKWAGYLCKNTPVTPLTSLNGLNYFIDHIWENFYNKNYPQIKDPFEQKKFLEQGSLSTYSACWFWKEQKKTWFQWLSYGNSSVLVYDKKQDELFVPEYNDSLIGFLKNEGLVNWKDNLQQQFLLSSKKQELDEEKLIILATDAMAEYLVLSYLIIKSKNDEYWEKLSQLMKSDSNLSNSIFNNRDAYGKKSFTEVLDEWKTHQEKKTLVSFIAQLQAENKLAKDDITLMVISYNPNGPEYITNHQPVKIKALPHQSQSIKIPAPKPKPKTPKFKSGQNAYIDVLLDNHISKLYHFTDRSNIDSIKKHGGLYSWHYLLKNNIKIPRQGGNQLSKMLDARHKLENYVRLSICQNHPMLYSAKNEGRIVDPVILEIDPVVVTWFPTKFSDRNATCYEKKIGDSLEDLKRIHFESCSLSNHFQLDANEKPFYQAEVLVWEFIPLNYILNLDKI